MEVVDSDVALVCGLWLCIALERPKTDPFLTHDSTQFVCVIPGAPSLELQSLDAL